MLYFLGSGFGLMLMLSNCRNKEKTSLPGFHSLLWLSPYITLQQHNIHIAILQETKLQRTQKNTNIPKLHHHPAGPGRRWRRWTHHPGTQINQLHGHQCAHQIPPSPTG